MARGGFISPQVAVTKLYMKVGSREQAKSIIIDALIAGLIAARGRRQLDADEDIGRSEDEQNKPTKLVDRSDRPHPPLGEVQDVPDRFWKKVNPVDSVRWDWDGGIFFNDNTSIDVSIFEEVVVREKDINLLVKKHHALANPIQEHGGAKRERRRASSWDDWVAAVAALAFEQQIDGDMTQTALLDRINARLASWGLHPKADPTVAPTARAILERWRASPPVLPVAQMKVGRKP